MPDEESWPVERRRYDRHPVRQHAKILPENEYPGTICVIENISAQGAELKVGADQKIPHEFSLHTHIGNRIYRCELVWRERERLGVKFK